MGRSAERKGYTVRDTISLAMSPAARANAALHTGQAKLVHAMATEQCGAKIDPVVIWMAGERSDGSVYRFPIEVGDKCERRATVSITRGGKVHRRCMRHLKA